MAKKSKKEKRLSANASKLIKEARAKYATAPIQAIKHLTSINPRKLNLYDRQKIGREILRRAKGEAESIHEERNKVIKKGGDGWPESYSHARQIAEERLHKAGIGDISVYNIKFEGRKDMDDPEYHKTMTEYIPPKKGDHVFYKVTSHKKPYPEQGDPISQKRMKNVIARANAKKEAIRLIDRGGIMRDPEVAADDYQSAGRWFEEAGVVDKALEAYKKSLAKINEGESNKRYPGGSYEQRGSINKRIKSLQKERDKTKDISSKLVPTILTIGGLAGAGFFLTSSKITGNAIGTLSNSTSSGMGLGLLVLGIVAGFFLLKN